MSGGTGAVSQGIWDRLGVLASSACAVHCAISAVLPTALAAAGLGALIGHEAEWAFTGAAVLLAVLAAVHGWRQHRSFATVAWLAAGAIGLLGARFLEEQGSHEVGTTVSVGAAIALVVGHIVNFRAIRRCDAACRDVAASEVV